MSPAVAAVTAKNQLLNAVDVTTSIRAKENEILQLQDNPTGGANEVYIFSLVATHVVLSSGALISRFGHCANCSL